MSRCPQPHTDVGLQPERTLLAWGRTLLAMLVASLFCLRWLPRHGAVTGGLVLLTLVVALLIWLTQKKRYARQVTAINEARLRPDRVSVLGLGAAVTTLGATALWIIH